MTNLFFIKLIDTGINTTETTNSTVLKNTTKIEISNSVKELTLLNQSMSYGQQYAPNYRPRKTDGVPNLNVETHLQLGIYEEQHPQQMQAYPVATTDQAGLFWEIHPAPAPPVEGIYDVQVVPLFTQGQEIQQQVILKL